MLPEKVGTDPCRLSTRWMLSPELGSMLVGLDIWAHTQLDRKGIPWPGLWIQSGHRSNMRQEEVNPDVPNSLHTRCPSLAVDLRVGNLAASITTDAVWSWLGARWALMGGRWGGRFDPPDQNHFDLGIGPHIRVL